MNRKFVSVSQFPDSHLWDKLQNRQTPIGFDLEVTARCNNDCLHCYINLPAGDRGAKEKELVLPEILRIAQEAVDMGAVWCLLTGGEPLLREDFFEIYLGLKRLGLLVSVFTNACLVSAQHVRMFKHYPPRDLEVSVYGITRETYEAVTRRPASFQAFRCGLDALLQAGVKVQLKAMALKANVHELPEIAAFCRAHTRDFFRFDPLLHLRLDGNPQRNEEIKSQRLSPEEIVALEQGDPERAAALQKNCARLIGPACTEPACNHLFHCGVGLTSFSVSYDGHLQLCSSLAHPECTCSLRRVHLPEAWAGVVHKVRGMRSLSRDFQEKCRVCPINNLCLWCPAHAHLETGRLDAWVEYFCRVAQARAQSLRLAGHKKVDFLIS